MRTSEKEPEFSGKKMDTKFRNYKWEKPTEFENQKFVEYDFSDTNFDNVFFVNSSFENCKFHKGTSGNLAFFGCNFSSCIFSHFDCRGISVGANDGVYEECVFVRCDFTGREFGRPHFNACTFENCRMKRINFNDSSFYKCAFIGKIEDTTFNGIYHDQKTGFKILDQVNFSKSIFGDFVTFEDCDLATCIPPEGKTFDELLYSIYPKNPKIRSTGTKDRILLE